MRATQPVMPSPTRSLSPAALAGRPLAAWISSRPVVGLISMTEPLEARISRTAWSRINCSASCGSSVDVNDVADLVQQVQPVVARLQLGQLVAHLTAGRQP